MKAVLYCLISKVVDYSHGDELVDLIEEFQDESVGQNLVGDLGVLKHE